MRIPGPVAVAALVLAAATGRAAPLVTLTTPAVLDTLNDRGCDAGSLAFGAPAATTAALAETTGWRAIVATIAADLRALSDGDPRYGIGMRYAHRGFDPAWLRSETTTLQLIAVVNRLDRRAFHPTTCGELRFVYRLAHRGGPTNSRLPMTVNVVFFLPADGTDCRSTAARFDVPQTADGLTRPGGPLAPAQRAALVLKSVEVNLQSVRWPSTVRPDLGGHAEYVLRVFRRTARGAFEPAPLENTPHVERLARDPAQRAALRRWIGEHLDAIDTGTALVPDALLARRAISVTPHGLARRQNRPFATLFDAAAFRDLPLAGRATIGSPAALLRRLDGLTCMGCHQSRSVAGFHLVGEERDPQRTVDALAVGASPHVVDEHPRRRAYVDAVAAGTAPDETRPPAERGALAAGTFGDHCGLGDPGFARWTCAPDHRCVAVDDAEVGTCLPVTPEIGDACAVGTVDSRTDRVRTAVARPCPRGAVCERVPVGFPGGMCAGPCDGAGAEATCGAIALLQPFNECLATGRPFADCATLARPAALRRCGRDRPCRDDYVCARTPAGGAACLPPYFVLQMRVDGHGPARRER